MKGIIFLLELVDEEKIYLLKRQRENIHIKVKEIT